MTLKPQLVISIVSGLLFVAAAASANLGQEADFPTNESRQLITKPSSLQVSPEIGEPGATLDQLQGAGGIQSPGSVPQSGSALNSLQPNAGAESTPSN